MLYSNVQILGLAHIDAPGTLESSEIERRLAPALSRLGISKGILEKLSGISSRRTFDLDFPPSDGAAQAAEKALMNTGVDRSEIGVVVNTSVCRDFVEPSTASIVHGKLGLNPECLNFDLGNACLAFINGMEMVSTMIERGQIERGIVVNCDSYLAAAIPLIDARLIAQTLMAHGWAHDTWLGVKGLVVERGLKLTEVSVDKDHNYSNNNNKYQ